MAGQAGRHVGAGTGVALCGLLRQLCRREASERSPERTPGGPCQLDSLLVPQLEESALLLHAIDGARYEESGGIEISARVECLLNYSVVLQVVTSTNMA